MTNLEGKAALVTGASRGIAAAVGRGWLRGDRIQGFRPVMEASWG